MSEENVSDEDMVLITRKFKKILRRKRQDFKKRLIAKEDSSKDKERENQPICYKCKKIEYFKADCPNLKKSFKKIKKKAMFVTWSDSEGSSSDALKIII